MFCLLAVLLYIIAAQEECFDHQPLSQRTSLHSGDKDGFFFISNVTLIESQDWCWGFFPGVTPPRCALNTFMWYVMWRCQLTIRLPYWKKKEIYSFASSTRRDTERSMMKELKGPLSSSPTRYSPQWPLAKNKKYLLSAVLLFWARCPD